MSDTVAVRNPNASPKLRTRLPGGAGYILWNEPVKEVPAEYVDDLLRYCGCELASTPEKPSSPPAKGTTKSKKKNDTDTDSAAG